MHLYGRRVPVQAQLQQPLGRRRLALAAALLFALTLLGLCDRRADFGEGGGEPRFEGAQGGEVGGEGGHGYSLPHCSNRGSNAGMARQRIESLTTAQERVLGVIRAAILDEGRAPTLTEIGARLGLRSRSTVHYHLAELERKGAIVRDPLRTRGVRLR